MNRPLFSLLCGLAWAAAIVAGILLRLPFTYMVCAWAVVGLVWVIGIVLPTLWRRF